MESFVVTWRELLIVIVLVLAIYIAEMLLLMRSGKNRGVRIWQKGLLAHSQTRALDNMEEEVAQLREQVSRLEAEMEQLKSGPHPVATPYSQAIQMAQQGVDAGELSANCGISRGEAELIVALYRSSPPDPTP